MEKVAQACRLIAIPTTASNTPDRFDIRVSSRLCDRTCHSLITGPPRPYHAPCTAPRTERAVFIKLSTRSRRITQVGRSWRKSNEQEESGDVHLRRAVGGAQCGASRARPGAGRLGIRNRHRDCAEARAEHL